MSPSADLDPRRGGSGSGAVGSDEPPFAGGLRREGGGPGPSSPSGRPPPPSSRPPSPASEELAVGPRERFAAGLLVPLAIAGLLGNTVGGLLAEGVTGVASEDSVNRWRMIGAVAPGTAALLGLGTTIALVMAAVSNPRTSVSTRLVATFGAGLVLTFVAAALRESLLMTHLIVLFAGTFAVIVAGGVEALTPKSTRALGVLLSLFALSSSLRIGAWGLAWSAANRSHPGAMPWAHAIVGTALVIELAAQLFVVVYLVYRPGWRGVAAALLAIVSAYALSVWILKTGFGSYADAQGNPDTFRLVLQRALSLRLQLSGPMPSWVDPTAAHIEIAQLDKSLASGLLPLVFGEIGSITIAFAALASATRKSAPLMAAVSLAILSRGQVDQPLRALELSVAALAALVLSRGRLRDVA